MSSTSIDVAVRVRPMLDFEKVAGLKQTRLKLNSSTNEVKMIDQEGRNQRVFHYDQICDQRTNQEQFYEAVDLGKYVDRVLEGYHATVFVYGQTGSGKTFTMEGLEYDLPSSPPPKKAHKRPNKILGIKDAGMIPRLVTDMFQKISILSNKTNRKYTVFCSFLELYNEKIYDLLNPDQLSRLTQASPGLKLRWHKKDQFLVDDLCIFQCDNPEDLLHLFYAGVKNKTMASHKLNSASSRSHCVFEIKVEFTDRMFPDDVISSKMTLVDLAGSERSSVVNSEGRVAKEAIEINKSLFTLRQVINAIVDAQHKGNRVDHHIPFRDSKLTALLKQSFGGNSYCLMIACLSPSDENFEENLSTLAYATKVAKIKNEPVKNDDPRWRLVQDLKAENADLLQKLNEANQQILVLSRNLQQKAKIQSQRAMTDMGNDTAEKFKKKTEEWNDADPDVTQQLVIAIHQIRDLLETLRKERVKADDLNLKAQEYENIIATLMQENQEFRDQVTKHSPQKYIRQRVGSLTPLKNEDISNTGNTLPTVGNLPIIFDRTRVFRPTSPTKLNQSSGSKVFRDHGNSSFDSKMTNPISTQPTPLAGGFQKSAAIDARQRENHYVTTTMFARNAMYRQDTKGTEFSTSNEPDGKSSDFYVTFNGSRGSLGENEERKAVVRSKYRANSEMPIKVIEK